MKHCLKGKINIPNAHPLCSGDNEQPYCHLGDHSYINFNYVKNGVYEYDCHKQDFKDTGLCKDMKKPIPECVAETAIVKERLHYVGRASSDPGSPFVVVNFRMFWDGEEQAFEIKSETCKHDQKIGAFSSGNGKYAVLGCVDSGSRRRLLHEGDVGAVQLRKRRRQLLYHRQSRC